MHPDWWARRARPGDVGRRSPRARWLLTHVLTPAMRLLHRPVLEGAEQLPEGPYVLVANHSGGMGGSELFSLACCWLALPGSDRPLAGTAHPFAFSFWPFSAMLRALGAVPSTREHFAAALAAGVPVLVFPGGVQEITRPLWRSNRVDFAGHRGFLRLARAAGVPVVPMGIRGGHPPVPTLGRSTLLSWLIVLPRLLGLRTWPVTVLGVAGAAAIALLPSSLGWPARLALAWLWLASPFPLFPWVPWSIRFRIGRPLAPEALFAEGDDRLDQAYRKVEQAVQALVTR